MFHQRAINLRSFSISLLLFRTKIYYYYYNKWISKIPLISTIFPKIFFEIFGRKTFFSRFIILATQISSMITSLLQTFLQKLIPSPPLIILFRCLLVEKLTETRKGGGGVLIEEKLSGHASV